jgi:hypothetical protein
MTLFRFLLFCYRAYRKSTAPPLGGVHYHAMVPVYYSGAPHLTLIIGIGREAWIVTQLALEHQLTAAGFGKAK